MGKARKGLALLRFRPSTKPCRRSFAARLFLSLAAKGTSCSCARSARPEHDSESGLQPLLAAYTPPLRMAQEGACRPFLHPRRSVLNLSIRRALRVSPAAPQAQGKRVLAKKDGAASLFRQTEPPLLAEAGANCWCGCPAVWPCVVACP